MCRPPLLIVDDEEDVRFLLTALLRHRGFEVEAVDGPVHCLERLATMPPCVVMTDIQMPGMSGLELCELIRERHPETVTIVMSGALHPTLATEALARGAFAFLAKPVKSAVLELTLEGAMAGFPATDD